VLELYEDNIPRPTLVVLHCEGSRRLRLTIFFANPRNDSIKIKAIESYESRLSIRVSQVRYLHGLSSSIVHNHHSEFSGGFKDLKPKAHDFSSSSANFSAVGLPSSFHPLAL